MSSDTAWCIPPSILRALDELPKDRPVAVLLRHSVRDELPPDGVGYSQPLTAAGTRLAQELGRLIGTRLRSLHTSPLTRCVQTAEALNSGSGANLDIVPDQLLGDPGAFVIDGKAAKPNWDEFGHEGVIQLLVGSEVVLRGMARPLPAARFLVHHMLTVAVKDPGLHLFITHDLLVTTTAARLLEEQISPDDWPWYLEGAFFWREQDQLRVSYRNLRKSVSSALCELREDDVLEFARREIAATVGLNSGARFFLAGGAFKTLLTGRPPRDLDIWAPSVQDRDLLISALVDQGAKRLPAKPFSDVYEIRGRVVEVPHEIGPASLQDRLGRFDIALAAVGVEHGPGEKWAVCIHPRAIKSAKSREVLLLKPLMNWKYALTTLERLRRYATELAFRVPEKEEGYIRQIYLKQSPEVRSGMRHRFERTMLETGGMSILEEAACWDNRCKTFVPQK
jgi:hypothetical protein